MYSFTLSLTSTLDLEGWLTPGRYRYTPHKDPVSIVEEAGLASGSVWTGAEIFPPQGFDPQAFQPVASWYTDYSSPVHSVVQCKLLEVLRKFYTTPNF